MPTLCQCCFPSLHCDVEKEFSYATENGQMFWIGYMVCDPKLFRQRADLYDLHVNEIAEMNFDSLPVIYNHNKKRKPLGKVVLAWHDHEFPHSLFALAFLAVITNKAVLETPAAVALFGDTCPSLSTMRTDRKKTTEVSVTFCGARKGCVGMFVTRERVRSKCQSYGLFSKKKDAYKQIKQDLCASFLDMSEQKSSLEDVLVNLPSDQYEAIKSHMKSNREALESITQKAETLNEAVGLLSDFMCGMIQTRLALEKDSDSDLAKKRRDDFDVMKERGIFDGMCSDSQAINEMLQYCKECFQSTPDDSKIVSKVCDIFEKRFPELTQKLPLDQRSDTIATIDAAFNILNEEIKRKETKSMLKKEQDARDKARTMDLAKQQFNTIKNLSSKTISSTSKIKAQDNMSLDTFLEKCGVSISEQKPPSKKRRRLEEETVEVEEDENEDFINYALQKEKARKEAEERYQKYLTEYKKEKIMKQNERQGQIDAVISSLPKINKIVESFPDLTVLQDMAKKIPKIVEMMQSVQERGERKVEPVQSEQVQPEQERESMMNNGMTIDASLPLNKKGEKDGDVVLFDI